MHPRNAKPSVIFVVLLAVAVGTASWLGFHNGSPEQLVQSTQTFAQGGPVDAITSNKESKAGRSAIGAPSTAAVDQKTPSGKPLFTAPVWGQAELPLLTPHSSKASQAILATATLDVKTMPMLKELRKGDAVVLPLGAGAEVAGVVHLVVPNDSGWVQVSGAFSAGKKGSFMLSQKVDEPSVWSGHIEREDERVGYVISSANGRVKMDKKPLSAILCMGLPAAPQEAASAPDTGTAPSSDPVNPNDQGGALPVLSSKPYVAGMGVLYLDFDGETVTDNNWNSGVTIFAAPAVVNGAAITAAQITDVWKRVSEDYQSFAVTVTTDPTLYDAAPDGKRIRCIVTPSSSWYSSAVGGITLIDSFGGTGAGFSSTVPCWVFNSSSASTMALTISHEIGHSLGLSHDGSFFSDYYAGHDTGATSWGPIMGAPYGKSVTQWSNGSYPGSDNNEDDLDIIAFSVAGAAGFAMDEAGGTAGTAVVLPTTSPINVSGIISRGTDLDWYKLTAKDGSMSITLTPAAVDPDLDTELKLYDSSGAGLLQTSTIQPASLSSTISRSLVAIGGAGAGVYYISVGGKGRASSAGPPSVTGYPAYGSVGAYTLTGTYVTLPEEPMITGQPATQTNAVVGTKVTLSVTVMSNSPVTYQWKKNGTNILGKTASTLVFTSLQLADDATYTVEIKNGAVINNTKLSDPAVVNVYHKPVIVAKLTQTPVNPVVAGANVTIAVTVTDAGKDAANTPIFVWKKNNVVVPVGTNASAGTATLSLPVVDFYAAASYTCTVSNAIGFATSSPSVLTIKSPPLFKVDLPATKHIALGGTATAAVTVVGTAPFTYQWFKDNVAIPGATKATYSWAAIKSTAAGEYWVVATGKPNGPATVSATSTHMTVDVQEKPAIATVGQPPATLSTSAGNTPLTLTCTATGSPTLVYQWQFNNVNLVNGGSITGADTATLSITPVTYLHKGTYRCVVTNAVGSVTSKNSVVTVLSPPLIVNQPQPINIAIGGTGVLKVTAVGTPTLKYVWAKDTGGGFVTVPGTGPALTLARATASATAPATPTAGDYKVTITNPQSPVGVVVTSNTVHVTVLAVPKITTPPQAKLVSGVGRTEHFKVIASGGGTLTYQWQKNNKDIIGQTTDTLNFPSLVVADAGTYRCVVKNEVGTAISAGGVLTVLIEPSITVQPLPITSYLGSTISFKVTASGSPTLVYQWQKETSPGVFTAIPASSTVVGTTVSATAKTAALKLVGVKVTDAGNYRVIVSNTIASVTSNVVALITRPVPVATIVGFTPHKARLTTVIGSSILPAQMVMAGTDFSFVTKVRFVSNTNVSIAATFAVVSQLEMIINIPGNLSGTATYTIALDNASGSVVSTDVFTPVSASVAVSAAVLQPNDDLINAMTLFRSGTGGNVASPPSDNTLATVESNESAYQGHTVWYHWRPSSTTVYTIDTSGCPFDSVMYIYSGPNVPANGINDLTFLRFDDDGGGVIAGDARTNLSVVKGKDYYISIDSYGNFRNTENPPFGTTQLNMTPVSAAQKVDIDPVDAPVAGAPDVELPFSVGGAVDQSSAVSVAWLPTTPSPKDSVVTAKVDLSLETTIGTAEMFSWSVYDRSGSPLFALTFDSATGQVLTQTDGSTAAPAGRTFLPGGTYQLTFEVDYSRGIWGASLDGVSILENQPLSAAAIKSGFGDVGAVWVPASGTTKGGKMHYGQFSVTAVSAAALAAPAPPVPQPSGTAKVALP